MRILFVPQCLPPVLGGGEVHALRIAEALAAAGHDVHTVTSNIHYALEANHRGAGARFGPPFERRGHHAIVRLRYGDAISRFFLGAGFPPWPGRGTVRRRARRRWGRDLAQHIESALDTFAPDVVLTMAHMTQGVRVVYRLRQRRQFPLVYVPLIHTLEPSARGPEMRAQVLGADAVVTNTAFEKSWLLQEIGVDAQRVFVGLLGTAIDVPNASEPRHVLFLGRLDPRKGIDQLLVAMGHLWSAGHPHRLVIAGARFRATRELDAWLAALPPAQRARIDVRENVSEAEKSDLLRHASCLVLPSKFESFGLVLLEAWAHGVPVVAWDLPLFRDIVADGEDGMLARLDDARDLARAIHDFARDPERRLAAGAKGREKVRTRFRWSDVAERYAAACQHARRNARAHALPPTR